MENLSHEHVASGDAIAESTSGSTDGSPRPGRTSTAELPKLTDLPAEAPPPGLWSRLEAQLRREGIIRG